MRDVPETDQGVVTAHTRCRLFVQQIRRIHSGQLIDTVCEWRQNRLVRIIQRPELRKLRARRDTLEWIICHRESVFDAYGQALRQAVREIHAKRLRELVPLRDILTFDHLAVIERKTNLGTVGRSAQYIYVLLFCKSAESTGLGQSI